MYNSYGFSLPDPDGQAEFYADVPAKRLLAWIADTVVIVSLVAGLLAATGFLAIIFLPMLYLVVGFLYRTASLTRWSATPGMLLVAIEFRTARGAQFDLAHAVLHTFGYSLSMAFVLPQIISVALMATGARGQGLSDLVLGSAAINRPLG